jgi:hypothetical protein
LPCDLHEDTHEDGKDDLGLEQAPRGAGPMFSRCCMTSNIFISSI